MPSRIRLNNRLLPALSLLLLILYVLEPYRGWLVLFLGLAIPLAAGFFWAGLLGRSLDLVHERRYGWAQVGDRLEERFSLRNSGWLPAVWVDVDLETSMPGYAPGRAIGIPAGAEIAWATHGSCTRRGLFTLGPATLRSGDPLGLFTVEIVYPAVATILVTPPVIPLPGIAIAAGGRSGESRTRQHAFERSVAASTVREQLPADGLRLVHWPTTARKGQTYVRELEFAPAGDWWIFLDLREGAQRGEGEASTVEHGVILAASIAEAGMRSGQAVGLVTQAQGLVWLPPRHGEAQHHALMRALALASPGEIRLGSLLANARPAFRQNPSLIIITADLDPGWVEELLPLVKRRIVPTVLLFDLRTYPGGAAAPGPAGLMNQLAAQGVQQAVVQPAWFDRPEARPGTQGRWVWSRAASSRAAALARPADLPWRKV